MNINDLYKEVCQMLDKVVGKNEYISCFNTIIRRLNSEAQKPAELITITGTAADIIADLDDAIIDMTDLIGEGERFLHDISWDSVNYAVTMPRDYTKILTVYYDDNKMEATTFDRLKSGSTTEYYSSIGNTIYFNTDLEDASAEIIVRAKRDYPTYVSGDNYTGIPENAYALMSYGICFMLSSRPRYKDELNLALYKGLFEGALYNYNIKVLEKDIKSIDEQPFYTY